MCSWYEDAGWWFGTMEFYVPFTWECHFIPIDELHHFSEGWLNHQPDMVSICFHSHRGIPLSLDGFQENPNLMMITRGIAEETSIWMHKDYDVGHKKVDIK